MDVRSDRTSPWGRRVYYEDHEFDQMMDELRFRAGGQCFTPGRGVDVERVIMKGIGVEADYVDLPEGVMGRTLFRPDGGVMIEVSRALSEEAETSTLARRRLRTTLAHECGHFACHSMLFMADTESLSLFGEVGADRVTALPPILCRHVGVGQSGYRGEWWEYQANQSMAALLLPRKLFGDSVRRVGAELDVASFEEAVVEDRGSEFLTALADDFDVSRQAALLRLSELGYTPSIHQKRLALEITN